MSGTLSHWVTLRDYFEARIEALEKAVNLAAENLKVRLESMNEIRGQLRDQATTFITRAEHDALCNRVGQLEQDRARIDAKASLSAVFVGYAFTTITLALAVIALVKDFIR